MDDQLGKTNHPFAPNSGRIPGQVTDTTPTPEIKSSDLARIPAMEFPAPAAGASSGSENPTAMYTPPPPAPKQEDTDVPPNMRRLGPYTVMKAMARGGMGAVYYGEDEALRRKVAIKVMAKELATDETSIARFQREARATATIEHPNVAMIYMVGTAEDGSPFLAMEFVEGGTIDTKIRKREPISISGTADMMMQVAEALDHARKKGIIHRDIKPANIMLTITGQVKVVDFGLAKMFSEDSFRTTAGTVMGTPRYMSPEQAQGREVDYRSDIYALGATFYHLLTGRTPFEGDTPTQIMFKQVTSPLVPMRSINPDVPMEFDDVIRKCMAKDANDRYQDYKDLISDLSHIKLQWMARERGGGADSLRSIAALRTGPDGMPLAPNAPGGASSASLSRVSGSLHASPAGAVHVEETEQVPIWRYILMGGAAIFVVAVVLVVVLAPSKAPERPATGTAAALSGLLERFAGASGQQTGANAPGLPPADPSYIAYQYTLAILEDLVSATESYLADKGSTPPSLSTLIDQNYALMEYDQASDGTPIDGWGTELRFDRMTQTIISAGVDRRFQSGDDIRMGGSGALEIADRTAYDALEKQEEERQSRGDRSR